MSFSCLPFTQNKTQLSIRNKLLKEAKGTSSQSVNWHIIQIKILDHLIHSLHWQLNYQGILQHVVSWHCVLCIHSPLFLYCWIEQTVILSYKPGKILPIARKTPEGNDYGITEDITKRQKDETNLGQFSTFYKSSVPG